MLCFKKHGQLFWLFVPTELFFYPIAETFSVFLEPYMKVSTFNSIPV